MLFGIAVKMIIAVALAVLAVVGASNSVNTVTHGPVIGDVSYESGWVQARSSNEADLYFQIGKKVVEVEVTESHDYTVDYWTEGG